MTEQSRDIDTSVPGAARIWNYWLGGKDNYQADRMAAEAALQFYDMATFAQQSRQFLSRVVRFLAEDAGIRQFLDIGTGLPTMQNTHEIAQAIAPESRIAYVDSDPIVLAHARVLLRNTTSEGVTDYVEADYHDPDRIIDHARRILDFTQPVAVMFMGVLGHARSFEASHAVVGRVLDAVPSGSYLALWDGNDTNADLNTLAENYAKSGGVPYIQQPVEHIRGYFSGLEMVEPGLVSVTEWRPEPTDIGEVAPLRETTGGVARKP
ncbi:SAM-dependent methyltransferase [Pseudonocardia sp. MH-G8]|uniref:SAM-dependent methyltransferase n=1 Tax=Pseudonocardia sp. MH-G8 TaxID=1854588 RepID=UPI000B9FF934|nr:SAM-dependent methyltransferase [Pseudonocardia sp. MH-G8]OZM78428.1 S-adenosyl methyltransferase [Pseudonocardia sp. MH-G8]